MNTRALMLVTMSFGLAACGGGLLVVEERKDGGADCPDGGGDAGCEGEGGGSAGASASTSCSTPGKGGETATCVDDCDCLPGLTCQTCVNTEEHNCLDWCKPGDPKCNFGVATCPVDPGRACPSVQICQP